ncbi:MAG: hypothetical protein R3B70_20975 [Polyangiaceae bacterium]
MSLLSSWSFDGFAEDRVLVACSGEDVGPDLVRLPATLARGLLRMWLGDPVFRRRVMEMHEAVCGHRDHEPWPHGGAHVPVLEDLAAAFERGALFLFRRADLPPPQLSPQPGHEHPQEGPRKPKRSWVEIELLDEDGRRVPAALVLTLPDGTKLRPSFNGFLRLDDIDPGTCDIEFPEIDGREWRPAG